MPTTGSVPLQQVIPGQLIASALWNNEFTNVGNLLDFSGIGGYESTDSIMQIQTNPYPGSVTSHATSGAGEIERIRFQLAAIMGTDFWYKEAPGNLLAVIPIGGAMIWTGQENTVPSNFLAARGQAISRTIYSDLFDLYSNPSSGETPLIYGIGDGSTTFNLPDLKNRFILGYDGHGGIVSGSTGGSETHTLTIAEIPTGLHSLSNASHSHTIPGTLFTSGSGANAFVGGASTQNTGTSTVTLNDNAGGGAHSIMPPYMGLLLVIRVL